jgi:hypothetical protein
MDARLALMLFVLLVLAAAGPIVVSWLLILPSEREPFARPGEPPAKKARDPFAIFLLANISVSLLLRIPGIEGAVSSLNLMKWLPGDYVNQAGMILFIWFGFVPGLAAAYSAVRANPIRLPLLAGGVLTLLLWLAGPWLQPQIAGSM